MLWDTQYSGDSTTAPCLSYHLPAELPFGAPNPHSDVTYKNIFSAYGETVIFFLSQHSNFIQTSIMLLVMAKWSSTGTPLSSLLRQRATLGITVLGSVVYTTRDTHGIHMWGSSEDHEVRGLRTVITPKIGWTQSAAEGDSVLSMAFKCYSSESIALLRRAGCEICGREESILLGNGSF